MYINILKGISDHSWNNCKYLVKYTLIRNVQ